MIRLLTILSVVFVSVSAVISGFRIVEFLDWQKNPVEKTEAEYNRWREVPGIRAAAIDAEYRQIARRTDQQNLKKQEGILVAALELRPLATTYWMSLAELGMQTLRPRKTVLADLEMSSITGPNELSTMWRRAMFGILQWDILTPDARNRTVEDMAGYIQTLSGGTPGSEAIRKLLAELSAERRAEFTRMLSERLLSTTDFARLGLQPTNIR